MANSYKEYTGDGNTALFTTPDYIDASHLTVKVGGVASTAYTLSGTALTLSLIHI